MRSTITARVAGVLATAVVFALLSGCGGDSERELIASAKSYLDKKDTKAAVIQLKSALQKNPQSGEARFLLGDALLKSGDAVAAALELEKAQDLKYGDDEVLPLLAKALLNTGQVKKVTDLYSLVTLDDAIAAADLKATVAVAFAAQGMIERSEAAANAALRLNPRNTTARLLQARLAAGRGAVDEAFSLVNALLADDPTRSEALHLKGQLLWAGKADSDGAIKVFRDALALDPKYLPVHLSLIAVLLQKGDANGFRAQVAELKKAWPSHPETRFYETQLALLNKDHKRAREGAQQLLKAMPDNFRVLQLAGVIEFESGSLALAESYLAKALQLSPGLALARRQLAETYLRSGQAPKALSTLQPALEVARPNAEALALAAEAHLHLGDPAKAEALFTQASKISPSDPKVRTALALTQISKGNSEGGFAQLESLAATDPGTFADLALISARLRRNDLAGAMKAVERLQIKQPDNPLPPQLRGRILAQRNDAAGARISFERALALDPVYFPAVAGLAGLDLAEKKPEAARKRFEDLLAREPANYRALLALAELRQQAGATPAEIGTLLADAIKTNPSELTPRLLLINHHLGQRDAKAALSAARDAIAALPDNMQALDALGRAQLANGDLQQAITSFGKVAAAQPASPQAHLRLGEAFVQNKDLTSATKSFRKALDLSPNLLPAQRSLIQIAVTEGRIDDAVGISRTVQKQRPAEGVGYLLEGEVQATQKRWDAALAAFRTALERSRTTDVAIRLHTLYLIAGRTADAQRFAAAWEREKPRDAAFQSHLGSTAMGARNYARAETHYRNALALREEDPVALNNMAWLMVQQGKPGAVAYAERANQIAPNQASLMDTLALALAAENQVPKAIEWQRRAVQREPDSPDYRLNLAKLLVKGGARSAARTELETLAKLGDKYAGQAEVTELLKTL